MFQASSSPSGSGLGSNFCDLHHEPHRLYCESCHVPVCSECAIIDHRPHQLVYMQDAMESARANTLKLVAETRAAIVAVSEAIEGVQRTLDGVEIRAHQAAGEVRSLVRR